MMQRAGAAAAGEIALRYPFHLAGGALVFAGPGNNGGDAWVVARALAATGVPITVIAPIGARSEDACAERELALASVRTTAWGDRGMVGERHERLVIDGLLGTGSSGAPRGPIADAIAAILDLRSCGATVVALDLPSGLDASTGVATHAVRADLTLTFGTVKRGLLVERSRCGALVMLDIGLGPHAEIDDGAPTVVDARWVAAALTPILADAHKGTRKRVAIVGGAEGMAGAAVLAARGAARSGVGIVKLIVAPPSVPVVQEAEPAALAARWPSDEAALRQDIAGWADAVAIGPGLGQSEEARGLVERILRTWRGPVVLDADGLNVFDGDVGALRRLLAGRSALLTPHPLEFARLAGVDVAQVVGARFDIGRDLAAQCGASVLLKGSPTVVTSDDGRQLVSAAGTPALATAGSGDVLTGIAVTLLAQIGDALAAGAAAAWAHGRAGELAHGAPDSARRTPRGVTLDDVLAALAGVWELDTRPPRYPVLLELPAVGDLNA
jgi:NAD(P)H-hydrate epimerase